MKNSKKIIATSLLGTLIISSFSIGSTNLFVDAINTNELVEKTVSDENIQSLISAGEYKSIKKIELDSDGNPISSKDVSTKQAKLGLSDGVYTIDRGDGWVVEKDKGFIKSMIVPSGATGIFSTFMELKTMNSITAKVTASFGTDFLNASISLGYGISFGEGEYEEIYKTISAPSNKNLFTKVQSVNRKIEVLRVKNGKIVDSASTYSPTSYAFTSLEFNNNESVNQYRLYEKIDRCILGEPEYDIKNIIDSTADYYPSVINFNQNIDYFTLPTIGQNKTYGVYFKPKSSGRYKIFDTVFLANSIYTHRGSGAEMRLYKADKNNLSTITPITYVPNKFKQIGGTESFGGDPLVANLDSNETYLIMFNEGNSSYWQGNQSINYRLKIEKN